MRNLFILLGLCVMLSACTSAPMTSANPSTLHGQTPNLKLAAQYNVQLGVSYLQQGDVTRAKQKLLLATEQDPDSVAAWNGMAYFMQTTGDNAAAKAAYQKALALQPDDGDTLNNYGVFLCQQGKPKASVDYFQKAISNPQYVNTAQAYENAGLCALKIPDNQQAEQFFNKALAHDPQLPSSNLALAKLAWEKHDIVSAQFYLKRYNQLAKPSADSLWLTIELARQQGNRTEVREAAAKLAAKFPNSVEYQQCTQSISSCGEAQGR